MQIVSSVKMGEIEVCADDGASVQTSISQLIPPFPGEGGQRSAAAKQRSEEGGGVLDSLTFYCSYVNLFETLVQRTQD